jgi:anti-sigma-K factor RskA
MTPVEERWAVLETIGAYAAGELTEEAAREAERLIFERPDYRRLAESYSRMLVMLSNLSREPLDVPEVSLEFAVRRAYVAELMRNAEVFLGGLGRSYLDAFVYYLGLRNTQEGYGGGT